MSLAIYPMFLSIPMIVYEAQINYHLIKIESDLVESEIKHEIIDKNLFLNNFLKKKSLGRSLFRYLLSIEE